MSSTKKTPPKGTEDIQAAIQNLIIQGKKDGMIRTTELNAVLMPDHPIQQFISEFFVEVAPGMKVTNGCIHPVDVPGLALGYDPDLYKRFTVSSEIIK